MPAGFQMISLFHPFAIQQILLGKGTLLAIGIAILSQSADCLLIDSPKWEKPRKTHAQQMKEAL